MSAEIHPWHGREDMGWPEDWPVGFDFRTQFCAPLLTSMRLSSLYAVAFCWYSGERSWYQHGAWSYGLNTMEKKKRKAAHHGNRQ